MLLSKIKHFQKLQNLAKKLPDLTDEKFFTRERLESMALHALDFHLYYGTERVDEAILQALFQFAEKENVLAKMQAMQKGEIVNTSEKRAALHTATRDFEEKKRGLRHFIMFGSKRKKN